MRSLSAAVALLALGSVGASAFAQTPTVQPTPGVPGSIDITCDVLRRDFRNAARNEPSVTFKLHPDADTSEPNVPVATYVVPMADLAVFKAFTEKYDDVSKRKAARINARIGSDASPVMLPVSGVAWMDVTVGATTLGCDFAATGSATARRRLQAVPFARECDTCISTQDISARVYNSTDITIQPAADNAPHVRFRALGHGRHPLPTRSGPGRSDVCQSPHEPTSCHDCWEIPRLRPHSVGAAWISLDIGRTTVPNARNHEEARLTE